MKRTSTFLLILITCLVFSTQNVFASDYTVKSGDTLWKISKKVNVPIHTLVELNHIQNQDIILTGQVLKTTKEEMKTDSKKIKPEVIKIKKNIDVNAGADYYNDKTADHSESKYYKNPDFYNLKSDDQLTMISNFKTYQQTAEWSCGSATILMILEHFGVHQYGEWDIAVKSGAHTDIDVPNSEPGTANNYPEYGTSVDDIIKFFHSIDGFKIIQTSYKADYKESDLIAKGDKNFPESEWGNLKPTFNSVSLYASDNDPNTENWVDDAKDSYFVKWITNNLKANRPIMVEWGDWDGHWQAIIGYDNNGTPAIRDDIIIFADPYDTTDSWQDGYYYYPAERWFYMWQDRAVAPKPYQLQPFVIVEPIK